MMSIDIAKIVELEQKAHGLLTVIMSHRDEINKMRLDLLDLFDQVQALKKGEKTPSN